MTEYDDPVALQVIPNGPDVAGGPIYDTIVTSLFSAQQRIWIVTPYFIPADMMVPMYTHFDITTIEAYALCPPHSLIYTLLCSPISS